MSLLDQDQSLTPRCLDTATVCSDPSDSGGLANIPLQGLKLASHVVLEEAQKRGRMKCSKCGASRMFFCYTCCSLVGISQHKIPSVQLPVKIDIIKHPNETDGKSTAIHAKVLAPGDVTIYTYPIIPEFGTDQVVLVFPGLEALSVPDMVQRLRDRRFRDSFEEPQAKRTRRTEDPEGVAGGAPGSQAWPLQRVVFIDSTWNQTNKISTDERLRDLLQVELKSRRTCFWRHQKGKADTYLSTIEAIYYFFKDLHQHCVDQEYNGEYDNLLFFFTYLHAVVNKAKTMAGKSVKPTERH